MLLLERWTKGLVSRVGGEEQGHAMIMALIVLTFGALLLPPTLGLMSTGAKSTAINTRHTAELYAADAGVEYAIWEISRGLSPTSPITVNDITVDITVGPVTELPYGPVVTGSGEHANWLHVSSSLVDNGGGTFIYTVTITNQGESGSPPIKLDEIGVGVPEGFTYVAGSSSGITTGDPQVEGGNVIWYFLSPAPSVPCGESRTQTFVIEGTGTPVNYYSWTLAQREDVGTVSSATGHNIVSRAGGTTIEANVVKTDSGVFPASWKIN